MLMDSVVLWVRNLDRAQQEWFISVTQWGPRGWWWPDSRGLESSAALFTNVSGTLAEVLGRNTYTWLLWVAWASSQYGSSVSRMSIPRKRQAGRRYIAFSNLVLEITRHFCILFVEAVTKTHPAWRGGRIDSTSGGGNGKFLEKHMELEVLLRPFLENIICLRGLFPFSVRD